MIGQRNLRGGMNSGYFHAAADWMEWYMYPILQCIIGLAVLYRCCNCSRFFRRVIVESFAPNCFKSRVGAGNIAFSDEKLKSVHNEPFAITQRFNMNENYPQNDKQGASLTKNSSWVILNDDIITQENSILKI
ncbi:MAG: hypothetical protein FJ161_00560 [Gammaproteobacteria bacterium]|nr:hypothetical protein [Gammaproteobacteria bacterium]